MNSTFQKIDSISLSIRQQSHTKNDVIHQTISFTLDTRDPVVAYWSRLYALQTGLKLSTKQQDETALLIGKFICDFYFRFQGHIVNDDND